MKNTDEETLETPKVSAGSQISATAENAARLSEFNKNMANSKPASRLKAEVQINLEADHTQEMDEIIKDWQSKGGIVIGSLNERFGKFSISFRRMPNALGDRITQMINDYYREN